MFAESANTRAHVRSISQFKLWKRSALTNVQEKISQLQIQLRAL